MIASLRGQVQSVNGSNLVLDVNGVGYLVHVPSGPNQQQAEIGDTLLVFTYLHVRENEIALYGFFSLDELNLFRTLLGISGVGPRTAMAVVSVFSPETLRDAVSRGDITALARVPGIGRKTAQRMLLDLNDRVSVSHAQEFKLGSSPADEDTLNALLALGYSVAEAQQAISQVPKEITAVDERILTALRYLGSH